MSERPDGLIPPTGNRGAPSVWRLPTVLDSRLTDDVAAFAASREALRAHRVALDWSAVVEATDPGLRAVLDGLTVEHDADWLGITSISETLLGRVEVILDENGTRPRRSRRTPQ